MVEFMGKMLENPLIASSCIATESAKSVLLLAQKGVQGAILKSCADYERNGVSDDRQFEVDEKGYTYASSPFEKEILTVRESLNLLHEVRNKTDILLIPSFTANSLASDDWIPACSLLEKAGADAIQLDFFYMGSIIGTENFSEKLLRLLNELKSMLGIPIMPKLNVNLPKDYIIPLLVKAGVEYVSLLDSVRSPYIKKFGDTYKVCDRLDVTTTSCFGSWQLPLTISYTYTAAQNGLKVCAGGGIECGDDVKKLLAAGANIVQSATWITRHLHRATKLVPDT